MWVCDGVPSTPQGQEYIIVKAKKPQFWCHLEELNRKVLLTKPCVSLVLLRIEENLTCGYCFVWEYKWEARKEECDRQKYTKSVGSILPHLNHQEKGNRNWNGRQRGRLAEHSKKLQKEKRIRSLDTLNALIFEIKYLDKIFFKNFCFRAWKWKNPETNLFH